MISAAHERLIQRAAAEAELLDLDGWPLRETGELWHAARSELLHLLAELQEPTAAGVAQRDKVALNIAAEMARVTARIDGIVS